MYELKYKAGFEAENGAFRIIDRETDAFRNETFIIKWSCCGLIEEITRYKLKARLNRDACFKCKPSYNGRRVKIQEIEENKVEGHYGISMKELESIYNKCTPISNNHKSPLIGWDKDYEWRT